MSGFNPFLQALRDVLGAARSTSTTWTGAAAVMPLNPTVPTEVYSVSFLASAAGVGTFQLVDASATGIGGTVVWGTTAIPASFSHDFARPLAFAKGLVISYTATAAVAHTSNVSWSPRGYIA